MKKNKSYLKNGSKKLRDKNNKLLRIMKNSC